MTYWLVPLTLPMALQSFVLAVVSTGWFWWGKPRMRAGVLRLPQRHGWDQWYDFVTTIGYVQWFSAGSLGDDSLEMHELVHVKQAEDLCVLGAILGGLLCIVDWRVGLVVWATSGPIWQLPNFLTAMVRFSKGAPKLWRAAYYGSEHERSAYSQEYKWERTGKVVPWD